jgi:hypothetical protein
MADYDDKSNAQALVCVAPATLTDDPATIHSIDLLDFGSCTFEMYAGAGGITFTGTNRIDFKVEESDDDENWSAAGDDALILDPGAAAPGGSGIARSLVSAHASADLNIPTVGYRGKKRYARCYPAFGGTHGTGTLVAVFGRQGFAYHGPVNPLNATIET